MAPAATAGMAPTLYERLGGAAAVEAAVDVFYNNKVLRDETLVPFFTNMSMARQRQKQAAFLTSVFGGSTKYSDDPHLMFRVHAKLIKEKGLNLYHFHKVCTHLLDSLLELNVPEPLVEEVGALALSMEPFFDPANWEQNAKAAGMIKDGEEPTSGKPAPPSKPATLYERIGGAAAVKATVDVFYDKIMQDSLLVPYFEGVDMSRQRAKQVAFIKYAFGGSKDYSGKDLVAAHEGMIREKGLGLKHFDAVAGHLVAAMKELGVAEDMINEAARVVMSTRPLFDPARYL